MEKIKKISEIINNSSLAQKDKLFLAGLMSKIADIEQQAVLELLMEKPQMIYVLNRLVKLKKHAIKTKDSLALEKITNLEAALFELFTKKEHQ